MRNLIVALLTWFQPARGKGRTKTEPAPAVRLVLLPAPRPLRQIGWIDADSLPLVPRYLVHYECAQEARRLRNRRRALALATMGQDYVPERAA
ncbi:hypothetical protein [Actinacidiphila glaucinigra]|uniref:hypothetical protein n=1 Tax=Actinacidiphila glaucinigra TaxID=235986 RepID=UPI0035DB6940